MQYTKYTKYIKSTIYIMHLQDKYIYIYIYTRYVFKSVYFFVGLWGLFPPHPRRQCQSSLPGENTHEET